MSSVSEEMTEKPDTGRWSNERGKDGFYKQQRVLKSYLAHDPVMIERTEHEDFLAIRWAAKKVAEWAEQEYPVGQEAPECMEFLWAALEGRLKPIADVPADTATNSIPDAIEAGN